MEDSVPESVHCSRVEEETPEPELPVMIANFTPVTDVGNISQESNPAQSSRRRRRNLNCTQCDKVFTHRGDLNKHLRTHSGERPYECPHPNCTKRFAHSSNLRRHTVVHSGDKPFNCDKCGRNFNRKDKLQLHQQTRLCRKRSQSLATSSASPSTSTTN